jgi:sulfoxide reductase heme-binding subunit YedZ
MLTIMIHKIDIFISRKFQEYRKILSNTFLFVIPCILISIFIFNILNKNYFEFSKEMGKFGYNLIIFMLFLSPITKIFSNIKILKKISGFRKELGILSFCTLTIHFIGMMLDLNLFNNFKDILKENYLIFGLVAYVLVFILGITSNKFSIEKLRKKWFLLHKLLYVILVLSVIHVVLIRGNLSGYLILVLFIILKLFIYLKFDRKE